MQDKFILKEPKYSVTTADVQADAVGRALADSSGEDSQ